MLLNTTQAQTKVVMNVEQNKAFVLQREKLKPRCAITSKFWALLAFVLLLISVIYLASWNYTIQKDVTSLEHKIKTQTKVSITNSLPNFAEKEILKRSSRKIGQHFESIHLEANDGGNPLGIPLDVYLKTSANINNWKIRETTPGLHYDSSTGKITVSQPGYYRVYAQIRLSQKEHLASFVTYSFHVNYNIVATALWNTSDLTQSLSTVVKLQKNDQVYVRMGGYMKRQLLCYCKPRFTFFGLFFISS